MNKALRACRALAAVMATLMLMSSPSQADDESPYWKQAQSALADLEYQDALHALEKALYSGGNSPKAVKTGYRLLGEVHAALGKAADAERHFRSLLALDPAATLPAGVSPKIQGPFSAAQKYMRTRGTLTARCTVDETEATATVHVDADPLDMVDGARVLYRLGGGVEQLAEIRGRGAQTLVLPARERIELVCAAIDKHGNHLVEIGSWDEPLALTPVDDQAASKPVSAALSTGASASSGSQTAEPRSRPLYARWYLWGAATLVAGGAGAYFGLQARSDGDELERLHRNSMDHDYAEAEEVESRGKRNALLANIGLGAAGAFAVVTAITWGLRPDRAPSDPRDKTAELAPMPLRRGAGVSFRVSF